MRKLIWKCLAVVPLLALTLWWIRSDAQEAREVGASAAPLAPLAPMAPLAGGAGPGAGGSGGGGGIGSSNSHPQGGFGIGSGPGIDPNLYADSPAAGDAAWRRAPLWDDGKAEFCAYEVSWAHYGHVYKGRALLVLVKEPWSPALDVKADRPGRDSFEVLKLNHVRDVATGIYTYHQMASVFWRRDSGALQKIAATSSEACGISYAEMTHGKLQTHSYFDAQGDRTERWPAGTLPEDGLPAALRTYVTGLLPVTVQVFPSLLAGRYAELAPRTYKLERRAVQGGEGAADAGGGPGAGSAGAAVPAGAGEASGAVELRLISGAAKLTYTFAAALPHRLLRFEREDGTTYRLAKCERIAYWEMHDPGGEAWLPAGVR
ncbi:MAG: hypothetical protein JOZ15_14890 [Acidobacteria bacterium]|nr:hypothetical protein [Acidobacteriota bacterium]